VEGPLLDAAADRHPDTSWVFVYTREAHPGEHVGHHESFADKLAAARRLRDEFGIRRPILVDDLKGTAHRAFGLLPNMTWAVDRGERIVYKAEWTSAANVEAFVARHRDRRASRRPGAALSPYRTEQLELRDVDSEAFYRHLEEHNGPRALTEFHAAERYWRGR
jgi:hypothetical protein